MNRTMSLFLVAATALLFQSAQPALAITGGERDYGGRPNVGALVRIRFSNPEIVGPRASCTGTLIHPRVFLTAGHCSGWMEELIASGEADLDDFRVSFGDYAFDQDTWVRIAGIITHPGYTPLPDSAGAGPMIDVGVLILEEPILDIECAEIAGEGLLDDLAMLGLLRDGAERFQFTSVGYGSRLDFNPPTLLRGDGYRYVADSSYLSHIDHWLILSQNRARGHGGTGYGDSGGPTFCTDPATGRQVVVSITSRGDIMTVATGFCSRIDIPIVLDFLDAVFEYVASP